MIEMEQNSYFSLATRVSTWVGAFVLVAILIKFTLAVIKGVRLYILSQMRCTQIDFVRKYGKWAVVTGATDGIGLSIAKELAKRGMSILVVSRNAQKLEATRVELEQISQVGEVETIQIDLSDASMDNFKRIEAQINPAERDIGLLVNNAGVYPFEFKALLKYDLNETLKMATLNMLHPVHMIHMIMPGMLARGKGLIVNVSSVIGDRVAPKLSLYASTKTFVNNFTRQLQFEYARKPIDIILLRPGPVLTQHMQAVSSTTKTDVVMLSPDDYARMAINAISANYTTFAGNIAHGLMLDIMQLLEWSGLFPYALSQSLARGNKKCLNSPAPARRHLAEG